MARKTHALEHRCEFWALFWPSGDADGQWIAHCLNLDVVTQGNSLAHARDMLLEAVVLSVMDDFEAQKNPLDRPSAPKEYWDQLEKVTNNGERVNSRDAWAEPQKPVIVATLMSLRILIEKREVRVPDREDYQIPDAWLPDAWLIDAINNAPERLHI